MNFTKRAAKASLDAEVRGLEELRRFQDRHRLHIPRILAHRGDHLELEHIHAVRPTDTAWAALGEGLARLHMVHGPEFGFTEDGFIGLNPQRNRRHRDWGEFFFAERLLFQTERIVDSRRRQDIRGTLERKRSALTKFLNAHAPAPSLLHGDLWSGNIMFDKSGPWLIDPAVYYGDRETDIAMTRMFGGFGAEFYAAYARAYPLPPAHETRAAIYNLYHYLNHYNLFGESYLAEVDSGLDAAAST